MIPENNKLAITPAPPYYAVIFTSLKSGTDRGYSLMSDRMVHLAATMDGFLGVESVRESTGLGITVSYWKSEDDIKKWKMHSEHMVAQDLGRKQWYDEFSVRVAKVERAYGSHE